MPAPQSPEASPGKRPRRWPWIVGVVAALLLGTGIGATATEDVTELAADHPAVQEQRSDLDAEHQELEDREGSLDEQASGLDERESELDERESELDQRESSLDERADELDSREGDFQDRAGELDERAADIAADEDAAAEGTIPGSGVFVVGDDIQPGTYRTSGDGGMCYWARLSGTSGDFDELIANGIPDGPATVTIQDSDAAFETSGCGEWTLR